MKSFFSKAIKVIAFYAISAVSLIFFLLAVVFISITKVVELLADVSFLIFDKMADKAFIIRI